MYENKIESPPFGAGSDPGTRWCLILYTMGCNRARKDYISLRLSLLSSKMTNESEVRASAAVPVRGADGQSCATVALKKHKFYENRWMWSKLLGDTGDEKYLPDGKFTLRCEISYPMETENIEKQDLRNRAQCDCAEVLNEIYRTRLHYDVVLWLDRKEFRAHKAVLAARSPFLNFLFELDNKEGRTSVIDVFDMNGGTIEDLLRYIYTGEAEVPDNMRNLLATIDKHVRRR